MTMSVSALFRKYTLWVLSSGLTREDERLLPAQCKAIADPECPGRWRWLHWEAAGQRDSMDSQGVLPPQPISYFPLKFLRPRWPCASAKLGEIESMSMVGF